MTFTLSSILGSGGAAAGDDEKEFNKYAIFAGQNTFYSSGYRYNDSASATGAEYFQIINGSAVNYTLPSNISKVRITVVGSGGAGGTRQGNHYHGGGGGGGGAFACAEYTVSGGETLSILAANAPNHATSTSHQYNGSQSYVTSGSIINISANGGNGGNQYTRGSGSSTKQISGSAVISGTEIQFNGGDGGQGSTLSFGFGPEPYGAGGGGAAGFVLGNGGEGGDNNAGGYSTNSSGGGAVGGKDGGSWNHGGVSTNNNQYASASGAGGGADGGDGVQSNNPVKGGAGIISSDEGGQYPSSFSGTGGFTNSVHAKGAGKNATIRTGGSAASSALLDTGGGTSSSGGGPKVYAWPLMAVAHQGGGGGGSGYSSYQYAHPGGDAGPGGGGGGGGCYNQNAWGSHANNNGYTYFDYAEGTHRMSDSGYGYSPMGHNARGGHAGIFGGGGGGGGYYGDGGGGGFGGGGGGGGGNFGSNQHGYGGMGGPGLVLIEWKA